MLKDKIMLGLLLMFIVSGDTSAQDKLGEDWLIERSTLKEAVAKGTPIEIHNLYGDVRLRGTENARVDVITNMQKKKGDKHKVSLSHEMKDGKLILTVGYAGDEADTVKKNGKRRLDLTAFIPEGSHLTVRTHKGLLEARGIVGDVDLYSDRGKIYCRSKGHVIIGSRQGNITAAIMKIDWEKPARIESKLGTIEVQLPSDASLAVQATTSGQITTDYSIQMKHAGKGKRKTAIATLGKGKNNLVLDNQAGQIKMLIGNWKVD